MRSSFITCESHPWTIWLCALEQWETFDFYHHIPFIGKWARFARFPSCCFAVLNNWPKVFVLVCLYTLHSNTESWAVLYYRSLPSLPFFILFILLELRKEKNAKMPTNNRELSHWPQIFIARQLKRYPAYPASASCPSWGQINCYLCKVLLSART